MRYNRFHVTALCSPTRAALLTGRNNHSVGFGSVGEFAGGFPGYSRDAAPRLRSAAADPARQRLQHGRVREVAPDARRPAGSGRAVRPVAERLGLRLLLRVPRAAARASGIRAWPRTRRSSAPPTSSTTRTIRTTSPTRWPTAPSSGCTRSAPRTPTSRSSSTSRPAAATRRTTSRRSGPTSTRASSTRDGTSSARRPSPARRSSGSSPPTPSSRRATTAFPAWDDVPDKLKAFYARQMEVYAGFSENADHNVGRVIDAIEELGELDNTLILWIWGDNGASMEGTITGSFNELTMQNGIPLTDEMQLQLVGALRRPRRSGARAIMDPHYGAAWAWAGQHPVPVGQAGRLAPRRDPQPAGRALARAHPRHRRAAFPVHPRHRRGAHDPRCSPASRRRTPSTGSNRSRCTAPRSRRR